MIMIAGWPFIRMTTHYDDHSLEWPFLNLSKSSRYWTELISVICHRFCSFQLLIPTITAEVNFKDMQGLKHHRYLECNMQHPVFQNDSLSGHWPRNLHQRIFICSVHTIITINKYILKSLSPVSFWNLKMSTDK